MRVLVVFAVLLLLVATPVQAQSRTQEILVTTTAVKMPQLANRRGALLENRGPNAIWCAFGSAVFAVVGKCHKVGSGERFAYNGPEALWCVAETADQVTYSGASPSTTGGTVVSEVL